MIAAFISAIAIALENILDKVILKEKGISFRHFLAISITFIFAINLVLNFFFGKYSSDFFTPKYLLAFGAMIVCAFFYNIFFFWAMSKEKLCDVEPFVLIDRPITILLAATIFPSERTLLPLVFSLIAAGVLVYSRSKKHQFKIKKTTLALTLFVLLISLEAVFVKISLEVLSPITLYTFRTGILAILYWIFLHPDLKKVNKKDFGLIAGNSTLTVIQYLGRFYAILYIGVVQTSLFLLLGPVLALVFSNLFLKEKITLKKIIADVVILICVIATLVLK